MGRAAIITKMKLSEILKQFKQIEPGAEYSEHSRTEILLSPQVAPRTWRSVFTVLHMIETGAAVAIAGFFIFILAGSFSPTRSIAPIQYAVIDPAGLHAEAQAIDMQIQLADVEYPQVTSTPSSSISTIATTTPALPASAFAPAVAPQSTPSSSVSAAPATTASTSTASTTILSVDQVLQQLSQ